MRIARTEFKISHSQFKALFESQIPAESLRERSEDEKPVLESLKEKERSPPETSFKSETDSPHCLNDAAITKLWEDKKLAWDKHAEAEGRKLAYQWTVEKRALEEVFFIH
jgi:hypothetical protein